MITCWDTLTFCILVNEIFDVIVIPLASCINNTGDTDCTSHVEDYVTNGRERIHSDDGRCSNCYFLWILLNWGEI